MSRGRRSKARQAIESIRSVGRARGTIVRVSELTPPVRVRPRFVALVGTLAAVPAITTDMFLPQLPDIARDLGTTTWAVQLTVTMMLVGGAVGQLVNGPLSDTLGRRRPALWGLTIHVVLSLACAAAPSIGVLVALRTAQGFFNAAASVVALAVIRDRFSGPTASRLLSRLMLVIGVAPLFAPTIGTWVGGIGGWRGVFVALAVFGAAVWVGAWRFLRESLPVERRRARGIRVALSGYWTLLRDRRFVAYALVPGTSFGVTMSYVVGSPFVLQTEYGMSQSQFAVTFAVVGLGLVIASQVNAALVKHYPPEAMLRFASSALLLATGTLLVVVVTGWGGLPAFLVALWFATSFVFVLHPNATALALEPYGSMAGTAAAFLGASSALLAGLISPLVGLLGGDRYAMVWVMFGAGLAAFTVLLAGTPVFRRGAARRLRLEVERVEPDREE